MGKLNWARVILCGLVAGIIGYLLSAISLVWLGSDLVDAVESNRRYAPQGGAFFFGVDLAMSIWAIWLYAAIRSHYGPGPRTAAVAGFACWLLKSLQSARWVALGFVPTRVTLVPLATTLVAILVAVLVGAWFYEGRRA